MPAADVRYTVAQVTEEARDGWRDFCDRHGIDRASLAEVIGLHLAEVDGGLPPLLERWVTEARELAAERRRRS